MSLPAVLGVVFLVLKLIGVIAWPWTLVLAPFWVPLALWALITVLLAVVALMPGGLRG